MGRWVRFANTGRTMKVTSERIILKVEENITGLMENPMRVDGEQT